MGKSSSISCLKIIACGSNSAEKSDLDVTESKASTDKRGWSFSKRSGRHRVLSNSVVSELSSAGTKDSLETPSNDVPAQINLTVPEKISLAQRMDETSNEAAAEANSEIADSVTDKIVNGNGTALKCDVPESVVIAIQAAIRGYLAQRVLVRYKSAVKLQAAVRGHLVRRQAVGTLRCVQAIVKMQALVRARRNHPSAEGLGNHEKFGEKNKTNNQSVDTMAKENLGAEVNRRYSSSMKLVSNKFARQLLKSTPKTKRIRITCDPSKADSSWKWLERWMSVSSSDSVQPTEPQVNLDFEEQEYSTPVASEIGSKSQVEVIPQSAVLKSDTKETEIRLEGECNMEAKDADDFEFQHCKQTDVLSKTSSSAPASETEQPLGELFSSATGGVKEEPLEKGSSHGTEDDEEQPQLSDMGSKQEVAVDVRTVMSETSDSILNEMVILSDETSQVVHDTISDKLEVGKENSKRTLKRMAPEQSETDGKKFTFGSRKSTNPAFAAVQSKFEELSSTAASDRHLGPTYRDVLLNLKPESHSPQTNSMPKSKNPSQMEDILRHDPKIQIVGSDSGTKGSIPLRVDSPDRLEVDVVSSLHDSKSTSKEDFLSNGSTVDIANDKCLDAQTENPTSMLGTQQTTSNTGFLVSNDVDEVNKNSPDTAAYVHSDKLEEQHTLQSAEQPREYSVSDTPRERAADESVESLPQGGSPRSHVTVPELCETPSSQVSVNTKGEKSETNVRTHKRKSHSGGKRSLLQQSSDSTVGSSMENLPKDSKNGKRRNSLDHELRVSSNNSLPSYMQATESARAKAHSSPKMSPDIQEKDIYIKKRHSLPATNGKQGSPRMQRSNSQAQQSAKGNGTPPQNVTERRWQR